MKKCQGNGLSDFTAIAAVTSTLKALLLQELPGITVEETKPPVALGGITPLVGLYLYRVEHNPFMVNMDWGVVTASQLSAPPFGLNLHYLVTPYGPDELEIQRTLGEVMRTFHEHPVIERGDAVLAPALAAMTEELRILPRMLPFPEMLDLWRAFETVPYRLCVTYEVSTILIDNRLVRNVQRVQERVIDVSPAR
jgi:hypothetical protein